jgi:hypothetical protein
VECELVGETEVLEENLHQCHPDFLNDVWCLQEETVWLYITCFCVPQLLLLYYGSASLCWALATFSVS